MVLWLLYYAWTTLLYLHVDVNNILHKFNQYFGWDKRIRSRTVRGNIWINPRFQYDGTMGRLLESSLIFCHIHDALFRSIIRTFVIQLVSSFDFRGRYLLLFRWYDIRCCWYFGSFFEDNAPFLYSSNTQLYFFGTATFPLHSLSETSTAEVSISCIDLDI